MNEIYISAAANTKVKEYLQSQGHLISLPPTDKTYPAVAAHPDLYCCAVDGQLLFGAPKGYSYPNNIGFNGVQLGSFFIHNINHTDPLVLDAVKKAGLTKIHVKQGYTKCNLVVVDPALPCFHAAARPAVITADQGIQKALAPYPIDVLPIVPGHVALSGFPYGFLGGACGLVGEQVIFHGDLTAHPDFDRICEFISARKKKIRWFSSFPLTDIGSIITLL